MKPVYKFHFFLLSFVLLISMACSTRKNKFGNIAYHNITAKYNVNFNGKEALKKGIEDLDKKRKENFLETLPIYFYPPKQDLASAFQSFDRAIEKSSKSVFKHSILLRGVEYVRMMDEAYMMMGKAYFYKQDYNQAKRVFNYIIATYNDRKWGSVEEATIWLARCEMQQDYFVRAQSLLEEIRPLMSQKNIKTQNLSDKDELKITSKSPSKKYNKFLKNAKKRSSTIAKNYSSKSKKSKNSKIVKRKITNDVRFKYYAAQAEFNLLASNGDIESAIDNIKIALQYKPKKDFRVRLFFILGQLYEKLENRQAAQNWFLKAIRTTANYDMEFNARLHLAVNYDGTPLSKKTILKELNKMLSDSKNEDFRDQIYFAISEISRIDGDDAGREYYLAKSVATYTKNDFQRTFSSLTLADIYFQKEEYVQAQAYYDTALMSLPKNYPNGERVIEKASILKDLVDNLKVIQVQDSLQRIAKMSSGERSLWVNRMIATYTEEERRAAKEEADRQLALAATQNFANVNVNTQGVSNKWYFYNAGLVAQGATEFYRRFGNRKLEDNWRISNKSVITFEDMAVMNSGEISKEEEEFDEDGNPIKKRETDPKKPDFYTQDLPLTQEALDLSNAMIMNAMYNAGIIYFDQLNDLKRSNEMLLKMIQRFPDSDLLLPSYFLLWVNYTKLNNITKADEVKNIILSKYAGTDYAKLILDPDYYKKLAEEAKEHERKYEELYQAYKEKQWAKTIQLADALRGLTGDVSLLAKTDYLRAVAVGQMQGRDELREALTKIIKEYPKEQVTELAKIYLATFNKADQTFDEKQANNTASFTASTPVNEGVKSPFNANLDEQHHLIVIVDIHRKNVNDIKYDVANFNSTYFSLDHFNINSLFLNQDEQMVTVSRFKDKTEAMNYYIALTTNNLFFPLIDDKSIAVYTISATNYSIFYAKSQERHLYKSFFQENYLKK